MKYPWGVLTGLGAEEDAEAPCAERLRGPVPSRGQRRGGHRGREGEGIDANLAAIGERGLEQPADLVVGEFLDFPALHRRL